jgi:hypothetical protein
MWVFFGLLARRMHRIQQKIFQLFDAFGHYLHDVWVFMSPPTILDHAVSRFSAVTMGASIGTFSFGQYLIEHDAEIGIIINIVSAAVFVLTFIFTVWLGLAKRREAKRQSELDERIKILKIEQLEKEAERDQD